MRKRKLAALLIVLVLLLGSLPVAAASPETNTVAGGDTLAVRPEIKSVLAGETFTVDVKIEGSTPVVSSDVQILFDTTYLEGVSVTSSGKLGAYYINKSDLAHGVIWFGGGTFAPLAPPFTFATLTFKAKNKLGTTSLAFNPAESAIEGTYGSVLGSLVDGQVNVGAAAGRDNVIVQPASKAVLANELFTVDVEIEGDTPVAGADVQLVFDPATLEAVSVTSSGAFAAYFDDNSDLANGVIWFGAGSFTALAPPLKLATVLFRAKQSLGSTSLAFNPLETLVEGTYGSVLAGTEDGQVTIGATTSDNLITVRPATQVVAPGETFTVDVKIEGTQPVVASDVQLLFDTTYLEGVSVASSGALGSYFADQSELANGKIWFGGGSFTPLTPPFTFATLTFKAKQALVTTPLGFNWAETALEGTYGSVLGGVLDGQVTISSPDILAIRPSAKTVLAGETFKVDVAIEGRTPVVSSDVQILFDTTMLEGLSVTNSGALPDFFADQSDLPTGLVWFGGGKLNGTVDPNFTFATLVFKAKQTLGDTTLAFNPAETAIEGTNGSALGSLEDGTVTVGATTPEDVLAIRSATKTVAMGETFTVDVKIEGTLPVVGGDVQILFDTTYLEGVSVADGGALSDNWLDNSDLANGLIWFSGGVLNSSVTPDFTFATLTFKAKQQLVTTDLTFNLTETHLEGTAGSVLSGALDGQVTVSEADVSINPAAATVAGCEKVTADLWLNYAANAKSADVTLTFDPALLTVVDEDTGTAGTQIAALSGFLQADTVSANKACNTLDLADPDCDTLAEVGTIHFAASQAAAPWATGSGAIARITFRPVGDGPSTLEITSSTVLNGLDAAITHTETDGSLAATALAAPTAAIAKLSSTTARLSWGTTPLAEAYAIYRQTAPYYTPSGAGDATTAALQWDDTSALGSTAAEYYYYVKAACTDGWTGPGQSGHLGAFDFGLVPGN